MGVSPRIVVIATSIFVLLILAISLATSLEVRAPPPKIVQIQIAQAAKIGQSDHEIQAKGRINDTDFDRADILSGISTVSPGHPSTVYVSLAPTTKTTTDDQGMIGVTPTPKPSPSSADEGWIGSRPPASQKPIPSPQPMPVPGPQVPILALSYSGAGGPKHCRGELVQKLAVPRPAAAWKNGTCVDLPTMARCGVFYAGKDDNCEAQLFNTESCHNNTETFVNTVVFMPEERTVGAYWKSMWIRCGIDAPDAKLLDPSLLSGLLKKPPGG
ncbi:hypothetical protein B0J11DRAFT_527440 [Dendryphion nanum]|uniref:Uncharacterized protein n=1 Tax=Dendryphion nanum TaxID=256645 RepID=A0A9P9DY92_9PLEO|nr:hypothetical protein B0J11DRAFT_527440 [Dendryphion nanum]